MIIWRKTILRVGLSLAAIMIAGASFCVLETHYERWRAKQFFEIYATLKPGISEAEVRTALRRFGPGDDRTPAGEDYGARVNLETGQHLDAAGRAYEFSNHKLRLLHLGVPADVSGILYFRDGILVLKFAGFRQGWGYGCDVLVKEANRQFEDIPEPEHSADGLRADHRGYPEMVLLQIYPDAPGTTRRNAYDFNLARLTSLSDCKSAEELLPVARE